MKIKHLRVKESKKVDLKKWPTLLKPSYNSEIDYRKILEHHVKELSRLQNLHYAVNGDAILLIFQGMDGAGKDGTIKHVMSGINPQGCQVSSFKHPSYMELEHDFLWRTTRELPERGRIGIFNRSYYEEVLITRVHPAILKSEGVTRGLHHGHPKEKFWKERYQSILDLERHLQRNGTHVIKFFLHISKEEQRNRFLTRIDDSDKNWKLTMDDIKEREFWNQYRTAYEECLSATSTENAPWYVIPADDKLNARLMVSQILLDVFESLNMKYPKADANRIKELKTIRKQLSSEN